MLIDEPTHYNYREYNSVATYLVYALGYNSGYIILLKSIPEKAHPLYIITQALYMTFTNCSTKCILSIWDSGKSNMLRGSWRKCIL